ncbi:PREDICTED: GATA zinc finger domain-containing protein 15-like, partial [Lupinus angustifolius]|uniref:GATA zinc finger domain-containing protein 15-like n=1 Tax=Lupinus angustifolius TaxID=3871 RepID=UPI00092F60C5
KSQRSFQPYNNRGFRPGNNNNNNNHNNSHNNNNNSRMSSSVGNYNQTAALVCPKCKGRHVGNTCVTCFHCNEVGHYKSSCPKLKRDAVNSMQAARPRAQGRVFTMSGTEVGANEDLIQGTCNVNEIPLSVLFDSGATHSFIAIDVVNRLALPVVFTL